jgi:hypothetical protein
MTSKLATTLFKPIIKRVHILNISLKYDRTNFNIESILGTIIKKRRQHNNNFCEKKMYECILLHGIFVLMQYVPAL